MAFQILSLSGGGYLGLYTAAVLAEFEEHFGRQVADCFDLLAGTSVGGIIALGLAHRTPAAKIRDAFLERGVDIFSGKPAPTDWFSRTAQLAGNALGARYSPAALRETIISIVGAETRVRDLKHRVLVPAVNLTKGSPQVFKTSHHESFSRDLRLRVVDVALATSAAPTFFPLHRIDGALFADGGLYANAPDHLALHEAEHFLGRGTHEISILSVGTTTAKFSFSNKIDPNLGWTGWMEDQRLPNVMIASQQANVDYMLKHRLGERYVRIDQQQSKEQERHLALDVATKAAQHDLLGLAEASVRDHLGASRVRTFFQHTAPPAQFFNLN